MYKVSREELMVVCENMEKQKDELSLIISGLFENIKKEKKEREEKKGGDRKDNGFAWENPSKPMTVDVFGYSAAAKPRLVIVKQENGDSFAYEYLFLVTDSDTKIEVCRFYVMPDGTFRDTDGDNIAHHQDLYIDEFIRMYVITRALVSPLFAVSINRIELLNDPPPVA